MLRKLLKYDFKSVLKFWSIGALVMLALCCASGLSMRVLYSDREFHGMIKLVAFLGSLLGNLSVTVFASLTMILLAIRFYKNFFTDEGYLTFTLPVKLHTVLNSKLIASMVVMAATTLWIILGYILQYAIGMGRFWEEMSIVFDEIGTGMEQLMVFLKENGYLGWIILYIVETVFITFFSSLFGYLFLYCCITFGSIVAKKAKVVASIVIYYVSNWVFSVVIMIFLVFGVVAFGTWISGADLGEQQVMQLIGLLLFGVVALEAMLCSLLYTLQYRLLDRKLNLP